MVRHRKNYCIFAVLYQTHRDIETERSAVTLVSAEIDVVQPHRYRILHTYEMQRTRTVYILTIKGPLVKEITDNCRKSHIRRQSSHWILLNSVFGIDPQFMIKVRFGENIGHILPISGHRVANKIFLARPWILCSQIFIGSIIHKPRSVK